MGFGAVVTDIARARREPLQWDAGWSPGQPFNTEQRRGKQGVATSGIDWYALIGDGCSLQLLADRTELPVKEVRSRLRYLVNKGRVKIVGGRVQRCAS